MSSLGEAFKYLRLQLEGLRVAIPTRDQHFLLRYDVPSAELMDALVLGYGRYQELRCPLGADPGLRSKVERLTDGRRHIVLLGFPSAAAAVDFQTFWKRYARVYGPPGLRDAAFAIPSPTAALSAGADRPRPAWTDGPWSFAEPERVVASDRRRVKASRRHGRRPESLGA